MNLAAKVQPSRIRKPRIPPTRSADTDLAFDVSLRVFQQSACRRQVSKPPQTAAPSPHEKHEKHEKHETMHRPCRGMGALLRVRVPPSSTRFFVHFVLFVGTNRSVFDRNVRGSVPRGRRPLAVAIGGPGNTLRRYAPPPSRETAPTRAPAPWRGLSAEPTGGVGCGGRTLENPFWGIPHAPRIQLSTEKSVLSRSKPSSRPSVSAEPFRVYPWS